MMNLINKMKDNYKESKVFRTSPKIFFKSLGIDPDVKFFIYDVHRNERVSGLYKFTEEYYLLHNEGGEGEEVYSRCNEENFIEKYFVNIVLGKIILIYDPAEYYSIAQSKSGFTYIENYAGLDITKDNFYRQTKNYYLSIEELKIAAKTYYIHDSSID